MIDDAEFIATMKAAQALGLLFEDAERGTHWRISPRELPDWLEENRVFLRPF
ncbi:hypothetical protein [Acidimangrovimonas pyrenivorans]|uniref:Uncharacterized protein n=1 Tax=Acidimangrovimonas pyrenivorans TaxID=2030798 RepID=A0ABV7AGS3_9RHOB